MGVDQRFDRHLEHYMPKINEDVTPEWLATRIAATRAALEDPHNSEEIGVIQAEFDELVTAWNTLPQTSGLSLEDVINQEYV